MEEKALEGVKVLEFCKDVAGAFASKILADLGAEVIRIENPKTGDPLRGKGPFLRDIPHPEKSGLFLYLNTSKLGITLNPELPSGKTIFERLARDVDVLIEDNPPGFMEKIGLGYAHLKGMNRKLIYASVTPFGQTGPYRDFKAYYLNLFHAGGEGYLTPGSTYMVWEDNIDRPPLKAGNLVGEFDAGMQAAIAILGALFYQRVSGKGQHVDISRQEAMMNLYPSEPPRYFNEDGYVGSRATQGQTLGGVFPCKDGYVALIFFEDREWHALLRVMGREDLVADESWNKRSRVILERREEAQALMLEWTLEHTKEEIYHTVQKAGGACGMVLTPGEVVNSPQIRARGFMQELEHPLAGKIEYPTYPFKFSETPVKLAKPAPLLGEHNEEIYIRRLGFGKEELVRLREAGII